MFQTILIGLSVLVISSIAYVVFRAWRNGISLNEPFQRQRSTPPIVAPASIPAPAPPVDIPVSMEPPRIVAPAGPNSPNATGGSKKVSFSPEAEPTDPYDDVNGETPLRDSMRRPERSFGPGLENSGTNLSVDAGISSRSVENAVGSFSPEFAQNGGDFMKGIGANDMTVESYANA
jgi:hypothetical protein